MNQSKIKKALLALAITTIAGCSTTEKVKTPQSDETAVSKSINNSIGTQNDASWYTEVSFDQGSSKLDKSDCTALDDLVKKSMDAGKVEVIKIISWADHAYPSKARKSLTENQEKLADSRNDHIKNYLKDNTVRLSSK